MATIRKVELPDGSTFSMTDWGDYPIYSRAQIAPARAADVVVFNYVQSGLIPGGGAAAQATLKDTNMLAASQLPLRHQMVVFSVQIELDEADSDNIGRLTQADTVAEGIIAWNNVVMNIYFTLQIENVKPYVEGAITRFPYGGGLYLVQSEQPEILISPTPLRVTTSAYQMQNGVPGAHGARRLAQPVHLGALETFQGIYKFPRGALPANTSGTAISPTFDIGLTCYLVGPRQRPIG